jgi:hypothetical protein
MDSTRAFFSLMGAIGLVACRAERAVRADTSTVALRHAATAPPEADTLLAAVRETCSEVAKSWGAGAGTALHATMDSVMAVWSGATGTVPIRGCYVNAKDSAAFAKPDSGGKMRNGRGGNPYWRDAQQRGWVRLVRTMADGPDGESAAYQRALVRCYVSESWDGGDDSDSTYVPGTWFQQETWCWRERRSLAASDTASDEGFTRPVRLVRLGIGDPRRFGVLRVR